MSPRLASAMTIRPAAVASAIEPLELGHPGRAVALEERDLRLDHADHAGERLDAGRDRTHAAPWRRRAAPTPPAAPPTGRCPAHSGPVAATAAATRSPKLSAIASSFVRSDRHRRSSCGRAAPSRRSPSLAGRPSPTRRAPLDGCPPRVVPWSSHQRASWRSTFHGARGSRNVAVPTWTASAPASRNSTASRPENTPPTPTIGSVGEGRPALPHGPHRHRVHGAPESPPPPAPRTGRPVSMSSARPSSVFTRVSPSAPPSTRAGGDLDEVGHVRAELGPARQAARGGRQDAAPSPRPSGRTSASGPPRWDSSR